MSFPPAVADFKTQFARDFIYGATQETVMDADITRALNEANSVFNQGIWDTSEVNIAYLYAAAHFLVLNLQAAGGLSRENLGGGADNQGGGWIQSSGVGGVNVQFAAPASITENAILSGFMRTDYGQRYLQLLTPRLVGGGYVVGGYTESDVNVQQ